MFTLANTFVLAGLRVGVVGSVLSGGCGVGRVLRRGRLLIGSALLVVYVAFILLVVTTVVRKRVAPVVFSVFF